MPAFIKRIHLRRAARGSRPFDIFTHLTDDEKVLLFDLSRSLPPEPTVVEIGSYLGASTSFLAAGARTKGGTVYAVDTWTNLEMTEGSRDTYEEFARNTSALSRWIVPLRGLSKDVAPGFDESIDLLFVDGGHSYDSVRTDLGSWLPKVRKSGTVVLHDYGWASGVKEAVREFLVPIQADGGRRLGQMYWAHVDHDKSTRPVTAAAASIIVPTYDRPRYLLDTLKSVQSVDDGGVEYEVLVVDNKPTGEVRETVARLQSTAEMPLRYLEVEEVGLHNARHAGARAAEGEILVYIDDDVIVHDGWLRSITEPFVDRQVAIVAGRVVPRWEAEKPEWVDHFPPSYLSLLDRGDHSQELEWPATAHGCNMAVRRAALFEAGGFNPDAIGDPRLIWRRGDGETGLHRKVYDIGLKVVYEPEATVSHRVPASRITPGYFCRRALLQGISDAYTHVRASRLPARRLLRRAASCLMVAARHYRQSLQDRESPIRSRADSYYWFASAQHYARVAASPALRRHVLAETYLV